MTEREARNYRLSEHYTLWELIRSEYAINNGLIAMQLAITEGAIDNLRRLCVNILEPVRLHFGAITINSGYRCKELNRRLGGADNSQHVKGEAADIYMPAPILRKAAIYIASMLPFDQLINEYDYRWLHVSYRDGSNRGEILKRTKNGYERIKINGL